MLGQTLSHYRITARIGAGGMGEVYRATDTSLGRDVAIKVLPPEVAGDAERLARFKREAHLLACLNHPHIAAIYGLEEAAGRPFLALELVEGEDLKQRLDRGAIPVDEALQIAVQVAEALEEAHVKGIVHRDLKPANVKLTPNGQVKVLDFGLAKAWAGDGDGSGSSSSSALSQSPTLAHTGTIAGVILGTAAYMSPEQARGKPVDKRADVWSFGVLLWEMLTGRALFAGDTVTDVIAAVVTKEPDLDALPATTPTAVRKLIARCLRKDPRQRLPDIGAARLELQEAIAGQVDGPKVSEAARGGSDVRNLTRERSTWAAGLLLAVAWAGYSTVARLAERPDLRPAGNFVLDVPDGLTPLDDWGAPAAISPDGRQVVFAATSKAGRLRLWVRALDGGASRELPEAEGVLPFWSPDGESIGFFSSGELRRVGVASGSVQKVCSLPPGFATGGDWTADGTILFSAGGLGARIYTVSASGGEAKPLTTHDESRGETAHWWPKLLADGVHFLFLVSGRSEGRGVFLARLDAPQARRRLLPALTRADYQMGHLLFVRDQTLLAQPVDLTAGRLTGAPLALASSVESWGGGFEWGWFSAGAGGLLVYAEARPESGSELVWFDRKGTRLGTVGQPDLYNQIALSPDEKLVATDVGKGVERDIWTVDVARGARTRQTFGAADVDPVWSPDGRDLAFASFRDGSVRLYRKALQGSQAEKPLAGSPEGAFPDSWSADGKEILFHRQDGERYVIGHLDPASGAAADPLVESSYDLDEPQVSPDGRWLAYVSSESGSWGVCVEPFRRPGERVRVSPRYGGQPKWRGDGKELFYVGPGGQLMAVEVKPSTDRLDLGLPVALFGGVIEDYGTDKYAPTRDGQRFMVIVPTDSNPGRRIRVITNWTSLLEKK